MNDTTLYLIVFITLAHFVVAVVFLLRKLSGPVKGDSPEDPATLADKPSES